MRGGGGTRREGLIGRSEASRVEVEAPDLTVVNAMRFREQRAFFVFFFCFVSFLSLRTEALFRLNLLLPLSGQREREEKMEFP